MIQMGLRMSKAFDSIALSVDAIKLLTKRDKNLRRPKPRIIDLFGLPSTERLWYFVTTSVGSVTPRADIAPQVCIGPIKYEYSLDTLAESKLLKRQKNESTTYNQPKS